MFNLVNTVNTIKSANLKGKTIAIALILLLTISAAVAVLPHVNAQINTYSSTPTLGSNGLWNEPTFAGLTIAPNPVGVGQTAQVIMLIELLPPSIGIEATTTTTGGWIGLTLTVTDPNGTATTLGPYETDVTGTYQIGYTPDTVGTYTFVMHFPGQTVNGTGYGDYYANFQASTSRTISLTVQQTPISGYSEAPVPLPTQYWTQPINAQNRYWNTISGPWLQSGYNATGAYNPYTYAPDSAHIVWKNQEYTITAGLAGGAYGSLQSLGSENGVGALGFSTPIIMEGRMYYNGPIVPLANGTEQYYMYCADLATGKVQWQVPLYPAPGAPNTAATITCGQMLDWRTQQTHGIWPYIWTISSGMYKMYSGVNGELQAEWYNLPAGAAVANSTVVPSIFGGVTFTTSITHTAVSVLPGTVVLQQPNPTVVGQDIGGGSGGGALLVYILGNTGNGATNAWLACWNSTLAIDSIDNDVVDWPLGSSGDSFNGGIGNGPPDYFPTIAAQQTTLPLDWAWGIMWNLTIPNPTFLNKGQSSGSNYLTIPNAWSIVGADGNYVILQSGISDPTLNGGTAVKTLAAINVANQPMTTVTDVSTVLASAARQTYYQIGGDVQVPTQGTFAWIENFTLPAYDQGAGTPTLGQGGNIILSDGSVEQVWDFSETTGALLWTCSPYNNDFVMQSQSQGVVANGINYIPGYDGYLHAINVATGVQIWDSPTIAGGLEMPQPYYPCSGVTVADGKVYTTTAKAYEQQPLFRGHELLCFDANTGAELWNISGQISVGAIADGYLVGSNAYDGCVYCFNRGPTATTVEAPMTAVPAGSPMIIQGTVTDQTPNAIEQGTPAISDQWMTPWMEYLYMDQPYPSQATGVPVSIDAVDPNGNFIHIGNATSDITGSYSYQWTPPDVPGKYTIITTFSADNSYYGSSGECAASVVSPASAAASPTPTPTSVADMYFVPAIAGIIVVIIIGFIVLALLMLRKRP